MNAESKKDGLPRKPKELWKNELFRSIFLILVVVLSVFAFREVLILALRTEYPLETPISGSMAPLINKGDLLVVQGGFSAENIYAHPVDGDIIVFKQPGLEDVLIVHRAIDKFNEDGTWYFITKGDANPGRDPWGRVPEKNLIGKVIWYVPLLGYIKIYLGTPIGMIISIVLLVAVLFLENVTSGERVEEHRSTEGETKGDQKMQQSTIKYKWHYGKSFIR